MKDISTTLFSIFFEGIFCFLRNTYFFPKRSWNRYSVIEDDILPITLTLMDGECKILSFSDRVSKYSVIRS